MENQVRKKGDPTFEEEAKRLLKKLGYKELFPDLFSRDHPYMIRGHWKKVVLYHLAFAVTLETSNTEEQKKFFSDIHIKKNLHS